MGSIDLIKGVLVGIVLIAVGVMLIRSDVGIQVFADVGWVFLLGGIAVAILSGFSVIRR